MATYQITAPDGTKYRVTAPDGATQDQVMAFVQQQHGSQSSQPNAGPAHTPDPSAAREAAFQQTNAQNVNDMNDVTLGVPGVDALQFSFHAPPAVARTVAGIGEGASNFYSGIKQHLYDPIADRIDGGNRSEHAQRQIAENRRLSQALDNTTGGKVGNILGGVMSSAPLALIPGAGTGGLAARTAASVGGGLLAGYAAPSASDAEHNLNMLVGGIAGGALPVGTAVGRGLIRGAATPEARQLIDAGVKLTPGQTVGGTLRRIEDGLTSVPLIGDAIRGAQRRSVESFNKAAMDRALAPLGVKVPANVQAGRDAINFGLEATGNAYDDALNGTATVADQPLMASMASRFNALPARVQSKVQDVLESRVFPAINESGGTLSGQQFKDMTSGVLGDIRAMGRSTDPVERNAANALGGVLDDLKGAFRRSNGAEAATKLANADRAYRGFINLQDAAAHDSQGANGVFTPAQFRSAVKRGDASKGKSAFARGKAHMQDLSDTAASVLPRTVPDSGTPYRMFVGAGSLGGVGQLASLAGLGTLSHATLPGAVAMGASAIPYTRLGGRIAQSLLAPQIGPTRSALGALIDRYGTRAGLPVLIGVENARRDVPALPPPATPFP